MDKKIVLVTGAAGFVAGHLMDELIGQNVRIRGLVRPGGKKLPDRFSGLVEAFEADLNTPSSFRDCFKGVGTVYHLAASFLPESSTEALNELRKINVEGTQNVLSASLDAGVRRFIHVSSVAACEFSDQEVISEGDGKPSTAYGLSKREAEELFRNVDMQRLAWTIFRPAAIFGEQHLGSVAEMARMIQRGKFAVFGEGDNFLSFVYVKDVVSALLGCEGLRATHGQTYIVSGSPIRLMELALLIKETLGDRAPVTRLPKWVGTIAGAACDGISKCTGKRLPLSARRFQAMTRSAVYSGQKLKEQTGIVPLYDVRDGLKRTLRWYGEAGILKPFGERVTV